MKINNMTLALIGVIAMFFMLGIFVDYTRDKKIVDQKVSFKEAQISQGWEEVPTIEKNCIVFVKKDKDSAWWHQVAFFDSSKKYPDTEFWVGAKKLKKVRVIKSPSFRLEEAK